MKKARRNDAAGFGLFSAAYSAWMPNSLMTLA